MRVPWIIGLALSVAVVAVLGTATLAFAASAPSAITAVAATPRLVYSDEFDGPLDAATWAKLTPWSTRYNTPELQYYDPANVTVSGGSLHLTSENRATNGYSYASGIVTSLNRPKFSYGYFEVRAKLPKGPGIWPAFWLVNDYSFEIDGLEMLGDHPDRVYMSVHKNGSEVYQGVKDSPDYSADFHTYGIDWQPAYVKWYIDGVPSASYIKAMPSDPMWICLNTAVGGAWPGPPTAATTFPVSYDIDYVRVYDTKPLEPTPGTAPATIPTATATATATATPAPVPAPTSVPASASAAAAAQSSQPDWTGASANAMRASSSSEVAQTTTVNFNRSRSQRSLHPARLHASPATIRRNYPSAFHR